MEAAPRMSVLMIIVDDLRASLDGGPDGTDLLQRPNLDLLAKRGVKFVRAYAQCALCAPSRSSVLVGMRPDTTRVFDLTTHFRAAIPSAITLPQAFKVRFNGDANNNVIGAINHYYLYNSNRRRAT